MRLRNNFIELLHSGELSPELVEWMQLEPDDFYIDCGSTRSTANFIKAINTLIRDYKVKHYKVSSREEKEQNNCITRCLL